MLYIKTFVNCHSLCVQNEIKLNPLCKLLYFVIHPILTVPVTSLAETISAFFCPKILGYYKAVKTNLWKKRNTFIDTFKECVSK